MGGQGKHETPRGRRWVVRRTAAAAAGLEAASLDGDQRPGGGGAG